jgi:hypothetical protein
MELLTPEQRATLLANGRRTGVDHVPVVKFFNPSGGGTWLVTVMHDDGDTLDVLGEIFCVESGTISLKEMASFRGLFGLGIERDRLFKGNYPISVYAEAAMRAGSIAGG